MGRNKEPKKRIPWTVEEDNVVIANVKSMNIGESFHKSAEMLGRTFLMCKNRWYTTLIHNVNASTDVNEGVTDEVVHEPISDGHEADGVDGVDGVDGHEVHVDSHEHDGAGELEVGEDVEVIPAQVTAAQENQNFKTIPVTKISRHVRSSRVLEIHPIRQLDKLSVDELFDLLLNVTIKIQDTSNKIVSENSRLRKELVNVTFDRDELKIGYTSLLNVINAARRMALEADGDKARFRMDTNGNLESIG